MGKSTALIAAFGFLRPDEGDVRPDRGSVPDVPPQEKIRRGLADIPQPPGAFRDMTVEESLQRGGRTCRKDRRQGTAKIEANSRRFSVLRDKRRPIARELSAGQLRMVEIGRTPMSEPRMPLVDEPTAGPSKMRTDRWRRDGLTSLLVDQEVRHALQIADHVHGLEPGRNTFGGPAAEFDDREMAFRVA